MKSSRFYFGLVLGALALAGATSANAGAIIYNTGDESTASVALGVNNLGHLNFVTSDNIVNNSYYGATGLAFKYPYPDGTNGYWFDAVSTGCLCEGWGVSASSVSGFVDSSGATNLSLDSFTSDAVSSETGSSATSATYLTSMPGLSVTQVYTVADIATTALMKDVVTISNTTGGLLTDVRYVRVMDWDFPLSPYTESYVPTSSSESYSDRVTIQGTATTALLERSHDNGFSSADPLYGDVQTGGTPSCDYSDFTDCGPKDHGAYFRFNFGELEDGESITFAIYYGAAATEAEADAALTAEGIDLYSYGQPEYSYSSTSGSPTYIFGFKDNPPSVPEPASLILLSLGLLGLGTTRRRSAAD